MNNDYTSEEWGKSLKPPIGPERVRALYLQKRIEGAYIHGGVIFIPRNAPDPRKPHGWPKGMKRGGKA
jgi:hypothetical protein